MTEAATPLPRKTIAVVADYGRDDLAFYEVKQKLLALYPNADIALITVNPFDTRETAYAVRAAALADGVDFVYHNTAPRFDDKKARGSNHGEGLALATIRRADGRTVDVLGVNAGDETTGNTFSELVHGTAGAYTLEGPVRQIQWRKQVGSQFRSLHEFPYEVEAQLKGEPITFLGNADIPPPVADEAAAARAARNVQEALGRIYRREGNAEHGYVTVLAPRENAVELLGRIAPQFAGQEIDTLPLEGADEHYHTLPEALRNQAVDPDYYITRAGFIAAQLALNPEHEAAARRRTLVALPDGSLDDAETLYLAQLKNGAHILASNPKVFQFARDHIATVTAYPKEGRRVDAHPTTGQPVVSVADPATARTFTAFAASQREALETGSLHIPEVSSLFVVYADGYGNLKLSLSKAQVFQLLQDYVRASSPSGVGIPSHDAHVPRVRISLQGRDGHIHALEGFISDTSFGVPNGETAFSAGSSGRWAGGNGLAEIFLRGGSASKELGFPRSGEPVGLEYLGLTYLPPHATVAGNDRQILGRQTVEHYAGAHI